MTGKELKERRLRIGLNQEQAAKYLGISRTTLWRWENARKVRLLAEKLAEFLEISENMMDWISRQDEKQAQLILSRQKRNLKENNLSPWLIKIATLENKIKSKKKKITKSENSKPLGKWQPLLQNLFLRGKQFRFRI